MPLPPPPLLHAGHAELRRRIVEGHPVDPDAIAGWVYRGVALGMPKVVERLTWKTFQKAFWRDPHTARLFGWNVRLHQDGLDAPSRPRVRRGAPHTTWFYEVVPPDAAPTPPGFDRGLVIDYARARNPALDTVRLVKDPLVALSPGDHDTLLGVSYLVLGGVCVETPTYFLLQREHPVAAVPDALVPAGASAPLSGFERRLAEALMDAVLGVGAPGGPPPPRAEDRGAFWRLLATYAPPYLRPGLRGTVWALSAWPLLLPGLRRPFLALSPEARLDAVAAMEESPVATVRQLLSTLKIFACFALAEDPRGRALLEGRRDGDPSPDGAP